MESQYSVEESPLVERLSKPNNKGDLLLVVMGVIVAAVILLVLVLGVKNLLENKTPAEETPVDKPSAKYLGCYGDRHLDRALPENIGGSNSFYNKDDCEKHAREKNAKYFALQWYEGSGNIADGQCWIGYAGDQYDKHGLADNCTTEDMENYPGYSVGGGLANAVYEITN